MTHLSRNDWASALRLLDKLESGDSPVRHRGTDAHRLHITRRLAKPPGRREFRRAALQADYCQRVGLEHAMAVAFLYRLACRAQAPLLDTLPDALPAGLTPREGDARLYSATTAKGLPGARRVRAIAKSGRWPSYTAGRAP